MFTRAASLLIARATWPRATSVPHERVLPPAPLIWHLPSLRSIFLQVSVVQAVVPAPVAAVASSEATASVSSLSTPLCASVCSRCSLPLPSALVSTLSRGQSPAVLEALRSPWPRSTASRGPHSPRLCCRHGHSYPFDPSPASPCCHRPSPSGHTLWPRGISAPPHSPCPCPPGDCPPPAPGRSSQCSHVTLAALLSPGMKGSAWLAGGAHTPLLMGGRGLRLLPGSRLLQGGPRGPPGAKGTQPVPVVCGPHASPHAEFSRNGFC